MKRALIGFLAVLIVIFAGLAVRAWFHLPKSGTVARSEVTVTVPEGLTTAEVGERVQASIATISASAWDEATRNAPEGSLFPDTYHFYADATAAEVVEKMQSTMQAKLAGAMASRDASASSASLSSMDVLILASIVEREVQNPTDMGNVAEIFLKRLAAGSPLQTDTSADTFLHAGLPSAPICNPGLAAITAVLHPTRNPWYFFLVKPDGTVAYATTYEQHLENKLKYL